MRAYNHRKEDEFKNCTECDIQYGFVNCRVTIYGKHEPIHICLTCYKNNKAEIVSRRNKDNIHKLPLAM